MVRVFLDLEMNMISQKHAALRGRLPHEIIEIGAVKLDADCRVADRFRCYVRPRYNDRVHWGVARLTGIRFSTLREAEYLEEALPRFAAWLGEEESVCLYAWSDSDRAQWERELSYKKLWTPQLRAACAHWTDFQRAFGYMVGYRNALSLSRALELMGLDFDGTRHDALSDAENCARLMALTLDTADFAARRALVPPEPAPKQKKPPRAAEGAGDAAQGGEAAADGAPPAKKRRHRGGRRHKRAGAAGTAAAALAAAGQNGAAGEADGEILAAAAAAQAAGAPAAQQVDAAGAPAAEAMPQTKKRRHRGGRRHKRAGAASTVDAAQDA